MVCNDHTHLTRAAVALDLGTSGFRAQAIELRTGEVLATAITTGHPLPGANVVDHLQLSVELGVRPAQALLLAGVNQVVRALGVPLAGIARLAVCGNPVQLSLLCGLEVRDLAYPGARKQAALEISAPARDAAVLEAADLLGLELPSGCEVVVPPAIRHEVGADALAMIVQTGIRDRPGTSIAIDYGTNAEVALCSRGRVLTASTAAGPAIEGRTISHGMLAAPGAVADLRAEGAHHRLLLLDPSLHVVEGPLVDLRRRGVVEPSPGPHPIGITGTGVLAALEQALEAGLYAIPRLITADRRLQLGEELSLCEHDLCGVGKARGSLRAGVLALCHHAGIAIDEIRTVYMAGASGTYLDPEKAHRLGMIPPAATEVHRVGNSPGGWPWSRGCWAGSPSSRTSCATTIACSPPRRRSRAPSSSSSRGGPRGCPLPCTVASCTSSGCRTFLLQGARRASTASSRSSGSSAGRA